MKSGMREVKQIDDEKGVIEQHQNILILMNRKKSPPRQNPNFKKEFTEAVQDFEKQFKSNNLVFRSRFYDISSRLQQMHELAKKCYRRLLHYIPEEPKAQQATAGIRNKLAEETQKVDSVTDRSDPTKLINYSISLFEFVTDCFEAVEQQMREKEEKVLALLRTDNKHNYLQILAEKNLQVFSLQIKVDEMASRVKLLQKELQMESDRNMQLNRQIQKFTESYDTTLVSIAEILKRSEINEVELRQENRLQKQLLQSQKIEFERYRADFKRKPSASEKQNKIRHILAKKFEEREKIIVKQAERLAATKRESP